MGGDAFIAQLQTVAVAVLVVSMMVSLGLALDPAALRSRLRAPGPLVLAAVVNVAVLPLVVVVAGRMLALELAPLTGLVLCAAAPGGPSGALYTNTARADLPSAALLLVALPALGLLTTPLTVAWALDAGGDPFTLVGPMLATLVTFQALPLAGALVLRTLAPERAAVLAPWATRLANALLAVVTVLLLALKGHVLLTLDARTWAVVGILCGLGLALGYGAGRIGAGAAEARAGALVGISRNVTVALLLSASFFPDPAVDATVLSFALMALLIPLGLSLWWRAHPLAPLSDPRSTPAPESPG